MNTQTPLPITGSGITWAMDQIAKRFEQAAKVPVQREPEEPEEKGAEAAAEGRAE